MKEKTTDVSVFEDSSSFEKKLQTISVEVTTACDLSCTNCFALAGLPEYSGMPFEDACEIVQEAFELGFRSLHLTGGEPTIWKPFLDLLEFAAGLGYSEIYFNTHGGWLTEELCEKLSKYKDLISLTISLNGPNEIHDGVRGKGSYERAHAGLKQALGAGLNVEVFTVVGARLFPVLAKFAVDVVQSYPALKRLVLIQSHRVENDFYDLKDDILTPDQFIQMVRTAAWLRLYGHPVTIKDNTLSNVAASKIGFANICFTPETERFGQLMVLRNKKITFLHSVRNAITTYTPGKIKELLNSPEYIQKTEKEDSVCAGCGHQETCRAAGHFHSVPTGIFDYDESGEYYCKRVLSLLQKIESDV